MHPGHRGHDRAFREPRLDWAGLGWAGLLSIALLACCVCHGHELLRTYRHGRDLGLQRLLYYSRPGLAGPGGMGVE